MYDSIFISRGLSLGRLKVLLEVDEAGSISGAAEGNPVRQSQYSRQLKELESFFGCELTMKDGRYLRLTERGKKLAMIAAKTLPG
jgi:DNA-binding transcriptional LysR family regulator